MKAVLILLALPAFVFATPLTGISMWKRSGSVEERQALPRNLQDYVVSEHNSLRSKVSPPASNMKTMVSTHCVCLTSEITKFNISTLDIKS